MKRSLEPTRKSLFLIAILTLVVIAVVWVLQYIGRPTDTLSASSDHRRYSYQVSITPRKAVQGQPVHISLSVTDRLTKRPASNTKFMLRMMKYYRFFAQSPAEYYRQELTTDANGRMDYRVVPDLDASSEGTLQFTVMPSLYVSGNGFTYPDPDKDAFPQYENEDPAMGVELQVLPSIVRYIRF